MADRRDEAQPGCCCRTAAARRTDTADTCGGNHGGPAADTGASAATDGAATKTGKPPGSRRGKKSKDARTLRPAADQPVARIAVDLPARAPRPPV